MFCRRKTIVLSAEFITVALIFVIQLTRVISTSVISITAYLEEKI